MSNNGYDDIAYQKDKQEQPEEGILEEFVQPDPIEEGEYEEGEQARPDEYATTLYKYQVEADVPRSQRPSLDPYRPFYGRHAALGNTKRMDNLRHLDAYDIATILDECPTLRHRATTLKGKVLTELQLCRSNPEVGGFERRMQTTRISRQSVDQSIMDSRIENMYPKKKKRFKIFGRDK